MLRWVGVPMFARTSMFQQHWAAYVRHLEPWQVRPPPLGYYLGPGFCPSTMITLVSVFDMLAISSGHRWLSDPWWQVTLFVGLYRESIIVPQLIILFYYEFQTALGLAYELSRSQRAPNFMIIFTQLGKNMFREESNRRKFQRFHRSFMSVTYISANIVYYILVSTVAASGCSQGCLQTNPIFYFFWLLMALLQTSSGVYITVAMPSLLFTSMYYLHLRQQELKTQINKLRSMCPLRALIGYKECASQYATIVRLMITMNKFWAFHTWMYLTVTPVLSTYFLFVIFIRNMDVDIWWYIYSIGASYCITNLALIVYFCSRVGRNNQVLVKSLVDVYWRLLTTGKINNTHHHLHFESCMQNVRLSRQHIRTLDYQDITNRTFLVLFLKFGFVFFKLIANSHFRLQRPT